MKLLYATSIDLPSTRANRLQITSMAQAFAGILDTDFVLGLSELPMNASVPFPTYVVGRAPSFVLAYRYMKYAQRTQITTIYCREEYLLLFMILLNKFVFGLPLGFHYELHHLVYMRCLWHSYLLKQVAGVVSLTKAMADVLYRAGYPKGRVLVAGDAVDLARFTNTMSKEQARALVHLPHNQKIVVYIGTIHEPWKGAGVLYEAASRICENALIVIVGGKPHYVEEFNALHPPRENVLLVGHQSVELVPVYLSAADIAVLPNSGTVEISRISTSPMKLFEYMASGVPIVASDLPSIREVLDESAAVLVEPDSAETLSAGINSLLDEPEAGKKLACVARKWVADHTWDNRAAAIVSFIGKHA